MSKKDTLSKFEVLEQSILKAKEDTLSKLENLEQSILKVKERQNKDYSFCPDCKEKTLSTKMEQVRGRTTYEYYCSSCNFYEKTH